MAVYQFDTDHATKWGVNEAIFLQNLIFWLRKNKAEGRNRFAGQDGVVRTWTYSKMEALAQLYPFWSARQVRYAMESLKKQGVIVTGHFSEVAFDRTLWFAVTDESLLELDDLPSAPQENPTEKAARFDKFVKSREQPRHFHLTNSANGSDEIGKTLKETDNRNRSTETDTATADRGEPAAADPALVFDLTEAGVNQADARRLATEKPDECRRQLTFLPFVESFKSGPGAYLRSAIEQGFAPPAAFVRAQRQEKKRLDAAAVAERQRECAGQENALLDAELARLQTENPSAYAALVAEAASLLPPPIRAKQSSPAYQPALLGQLRRQVKRRLEQGETK